MNVLHLDWETRGTADLRAVGLHNYARHPETDIWLARYSFDDGPVRQWQPGAPCPASIKRHIEAGKPVCGHNVTFELEICNCIAAPRYGWPRIRFEQCLDTMLLALTMAHPAALEKAAKAARLGVEKDMEGHRLMLRMARPRSRAADGTIIWWDEPERLQRLSDYCAADVETERALHAYADPLPKLEQALALIDHAINARGVYVDRELASRALQLTARAKERLNVRMRTLTEGAVRSVTDSTGLLRWLTRQGIDTDSVAKDKVAGLLRRPLSIPVRAALELRQQGAKSSNAKIGKMLAHAGADGRIRYTMQQNAAGTGRWGGRVIQPQNLPRPQLLKDDAAVEEAVLYVRTGDLDAIERHFGPPLLVISDLLRGMLAAAPGYDLMAGDWSAIEGRALPWLAGETWKVRAYQDFDEGKGPEIYRLTAAEILGKAVTAVTGDERQALGKVSELSLGYGGGVGAFDAMAANYGVRMEEHYETVLDAADPDDAIWAHRRYKEYGKALPNLSQKAWIAADVVKIGWRRKHPAICRYWMALEEAALRAMRTPGAIFGAGPRDHRRIFFRLNGNHLYCMLPSGRKLCYPWPEIQLRETPWRDAQGNRIRRDVVTYEAVDNAGRWLRTHTYGGKLCIAKGTPVLTEFGWVPIECVNKSMRVWNGERWVCHGGNICNGEQPVIEAHGVWMTPDHEVLTDRGWVCASQSERYNRAACRLPSGYGIRWQRWEEIPLVGSLRLWAKQEASGDRVEKDAQTGGHRVLWLPSRQNAKPTQNQARYGRAPSLCGLEIDAGSLLSRITSSVGKLRRAWHYGLYSVARSVRRLLGGHGANLQTRFVLGPYRQYARLFPEQLPLGHSTAASQQQTQERAYRDAVGGVDRGASVPSFGNQSKYSALSVSEQLPRRPVVYPAGRSQSVYDLVNCGPNHRYVVQDRWGCPLIVHNCENVTQAVCADLLRHTLTLLAPTPYQVVMHIHDEIVAEVPKGQGSLDEFLSYFRQLPKWAEGLPIAATGWRGPRFKKD